MTDSDWTSKIQQHPDKLQLPGAMLMKYGPSDYVGAAFAFTGTLFFDGAHEKTVRDQICDCFDEYAAVAGDHLTWLWREEPPSCPDVQPYADAKPMRKLAADTHEDDLFSFCYTGGDKREDASPYMFHVSGERGWKARKKSRKPLSVLVFSLPILPVEQNSLILLSLFYSFAKRLKPVHGFAGHSLVMSPARVDENEPTQAYMAEKMAGLDVGDSIFMSGRLRGGFKTVSWLTALSTELLSKVGSVDDLRQEFPPSWYAFYDYDGGLIIQSGAKPDIGHVELGLPPAYVLTNNALKAARIPEFETFHGTSHDGEPRIMGAAADAWLRRLDVEPDEILAYKAKLLNEPKLGIANTR
ncbi:hypothetical protein RSP822_17160 [Ralstonia solanacearum]|uniref:type VI immunity family protein n=1 Tax=Ralstonia solanacearum TaxID=305 RepID=UPI000E6623D9|nr:type VI immunity family protein [Ralstonia solanacearum]RIJ85167.1 hypothetical protein RSP822_17160 [Ralstonia solanacearum]